MCNCKKLSLLIIVMLLSILIQTSFSAKKNFSQYQTGQYSNAIIIPGKIIVKFKPLTGNIKSSLSVQQIHNVCSVEKVEPLFENFADRSTPKRKITDLSYIYSIGISLSENPEEICNRISQLPGIVYAEPVVAFPVERIPNDEYYSRQQFLPQIKMEQAWEIAQGDSTVIVAIIDTGVDWDHPDLAANIWTNEAETLDGTDSDGNGFVDDIRGWDFVTGLDDNDYHANEDGKVADNDPMDFDGHGSHCAGCAAAVTDNSVGIAGVSWNCEIMPLRVGWHTPNGKGLIRMDWAAKAFRYAADNGAAAANLSTGSTNYVADAARYAFDIGVVITKSAGNANNEDTDPLDLKPFAITVAAVDDRDLKASYSSYGEWVKVSAPGGDLSAGRAGIFSTIFNDRYHYYQGTSMSAPIVAGLAALIQAHHPDWTSREITIQIVETADNIEHLNPGYEEKLGTGRINAYRALTETVSAAPKVRMLSYTVSDTTGGNANGIIDIGEEIHISVEFVNYWGSAFNAMATLIIDDWAVTVTDNSSSFGVLLGLDAPDNNKVNNYSDPFVIQIDTLAFPHRLDAQIVFTADGYSRSFPIVLGINPSILLVDDDGGSNNVEMYYTDALDELGYSYDYWDHAASGAPTNLSNYSTVIWSCEWTFPSLDSKDRVFLSSYLDNGGKLFLSGQDIGWDLCDPSTDGDDHEYTISNGLSKTFYENYLHAQYLVDESNYSELTGVAGDPLGDDLRFSVFQPGRGADQSPSEVLPFNGGVSSFNYPNGNSGFVHFAGDHRVVYSACGGYEAILQAEVRRTLMTRILNWLNGLRFEHSPFKDTENSSEDYLIAAKAIALADSVSAVTLYWDTDGSLPYQNKVVMTAIDDSLYQGFIPAQDIGATIDYIILATTIAGYYNSVEFYSFNIGADTEAPTFSNSKPLVHTLDKIGPYQYVAEIYDNMGVDTASVYVHYALKGSSYDSVKMAPTEKPNKFSTEIPGIAAYGDTVVYYLSASDVSLNSNSAASEEFWFAVGTEDFERGFDAWNATSGWGLVNDPIAHGGSYSITESPFGNFEAGLNEILELKAPIDLSQSECAMLYYWTQYHLQPGQAFGYLEISQDEGDTWEIVEPVIKNIKSSWRRIVVPLADYMGISNLRLRFRMETSASSNGRFDGWYIDDIQIVENLPLGIGDELLALEIPETFSLTQNYPNPFNPETSIRFGLPQACRVTLAVYNMLGQLVAMPANGKMSAGFHTITWNGTDQTNRGLASGIYFYRLKTENIVLTRKMLFMR